MSPRLPTIKGLAALLTRMLATGTLLGLVACVSPEPTPTPTPADASPGGRVVLATAAPAPHLDVHQEVTEALLSQGPGIAYSRLLRLGSGPGVEASSLSVECDLCSRWEHPDPLTYVFHLRQGVRWHDIKPVKGRALTARDVAYSLNRLRTPGWPGAALLQAVDSVEATGDLTLTVRLRQADADFLLALANGQSKVVAKEAVDLKGHLREGPTVGTGPWILREETLEGLRFEANPRYYEPGLPQLKELRIVPIPDASARLAALLTGKADLAPLDSETWDRVQAFQGQLRTAPFPQPGTGVLLGLKATEPPFHRLEVRQAFFRALDPWSALDGVWKGQGEVALGMPVASPQWLLSREEMLRYFADPQKAGALLSRAGVEPPVGLTLTVADFGDRYLALGQEYGRMLQASGFHATLKEVNPRIYAEEVWGKGEFQAFLGPVPPVHAPSAFLLGLLHSRGRWAITGFQNSELDRLIEAQSVAEEGRDDMVREIQRSALDKAILFMPVTGTSLWAWRERVEDFAPTFANYEYLHWARLRLAAQ